MAERTVRPFAPMNVEALVRAVAAVCTPLDKVAREMVAAALEGTAVNPETASLQAARLARLMDALRAEEKAAHRAKARIYDLAQYKRTRSGERANSRAAADEALGG